MFLMRPTALIPIPFSKNVQFPRLEHDHFSKFDCSTVTAILVHVDLCEGEEFNPSLQDIEFQCDRSIYTLDYPSIGQEAHNTMKGMWKRIFGTNTMLRKKNVDSQLCIRKRPFLFS